MEPTWRNDFVLAFDFGGTKMVLATADRSGRILRRAELPTRADAGADQALTRALDAGRALIDEISGPAGRLVGVGVSTMGITLEDGVLMAPNVVGWEQQKIPGLVRRMFRTDAVLVGNDVKAAAQAELQWGALSGVDTGIYLNLGTGIAAALITNGRVLQGAHGAAGEIGYNLRHLDEDRGAADGQLPLEEYAGGGAIAARITQRFGEQVAPGDVFAALGTDEEAGAFVEETLTEVAFHLSNLAIALDPSRIVLAGGLMRAQDIVLPHLRTHVRRFAPFPPDVVPGRFLLDGGLMGGVSLALAAEGLR